MLLIREQMDLPHAVWTKSHLTYKDQIVGFAAPEKHSEKLFALDRWLTKQAKSLRAFTAITSFKLFTKKATTISASDIMALPYPKAGDLDLSVNETILVNDIVNYQRDLIRLGESSTAMKDSGLDACEDFANVFVGQINAIYKLNPLRALVMQTWPGVICQPFVFGKGKVDWSGADELRGRLDSLLHEQRRTTLHVTRIARIYDGNVIFLLKPDRLRYWLRSIALRDADETLSDLRAQGF